MHSYLIGLIVFLHRLGTGNFRLFTSAALLPAGYLFTLVNSFEHVCDHRGSGGTTMYFAADVSLVNSCKRIFRLIGRLSRLA